MWGCPIRGWSVPDPGMVDAQTAHSGGSPSSIIATTTTTPRCTAEGTGGTWGRSVGKKNTHKKFHRAGRKKLWWRLERCGATGAERRRQGKKKRNFSDKFTRVVRWQGWKGEGKHSHASLRRAKSPTNPPAPRIPACLSFPGAIQWMSEGGTPRSRRESVRSRATSRRAPRKGGTTPRDRIAMAPR